MLYCPKCQQQYEEGVHRFCLNEGERLLPVQNSGKSADKSEGVFTAILNRRSKGEDDKFSTPRSFSKGEPTKFSQTAFRPPIDSKIFTADPVEDSLLELEPQPFKPTPQLFKPEAIGTRPTFESADLEEEEIEGNTADLEAAIEEDAFAEEEIEEEIAFVETEIEENEVVEENIEDLSETAEAVFSLPDNLKNLIGESLKGRYTIIEQTGQNETSVVFLAEDALIPDKTFFVRVLTDEDTDEFFAEERDALSSFNHPNVVSVFDSGEIDGRAFIVTESIEGNSVKDHLQKHGQFNALRVARIVRQASDALSEAHQIGVLHRNLKPENIILTVDEDGKEQVKLMNFGASKDKLTRGNLLYKSPEQVEGKPANSSSDEYSLAVIAYQMLTNRLPFNATSVGDLLKAQREGLKLSPSNLRSELSASIDEILEKALAFNASDRFTKTRDFGEEFFEAVSSNVSKAAESEAEVLISETEEDEVSIDEPATEDSIVEPETEDNIEELPVTMPPVISDVESFEKIFVEEDEDLIRSVKAAEDAAWEKRSSEPPQDGRNNRSTLSLVGVGILIAALFGVWYYFINRPNQEFVQNQPAPPNQNATITEVTPTENANVAPSIAPTPEEIESIPLPRTISQPSNTVYFQNSKENLKGDAMRNFLGFSLYYPKDWKVNSIEPDKKDKKSRSKFLDISKNASSGTPLEQFLVSYYNSKGTFNADTEIFNSMVKETNETLEKIVPKYEMISKGEITVNNGWRAYEVKFKGEGRTGNGEKVMLWGRRMFIPTAIRGMKNGYAITMLATSLSKEIKSVNDVGVKGELSTILETFEPNQNF